MQQFRLSMESLVEDERYCACSIDARLLYIQIARAFDDAWAYCVVDSVEDAVAGAFSHETRRALWHADSAASEVLQRMRRAFDELVEAGLLIDEELADGRRAIGYVHFDRHGGSWQTKRRAPDHDKPMGPALAAHREFWRTNACGREKLLRWADAHGLGRIVRESLSRPRASETSAEPAGSGSDLGIHSGASSDSGMHPAISRDPGIHSAISGDSGIHVPIELQGLVEVRGLGVGGTEVQAAVVEGTTEPPPPEGARAEDPLPRRARAALKSVGLTPREALDLIAPCQVVADEHTGGDLMLLALVYACDCVRRKKPDMWRTKVASRDTPKSADLAEARSLLCGPPKRAGPASLTCTNPGCGHAFLVAPATPPAGRQCPKCGTVHGDRGPPGLAAGERAVDAMGDNLFTRALRARQGASAT